MDLNELMAKMGVGAKWKMIRPSYAHFGTYTVRGHDRLPTNYTCHLLYHVMMKQDRNVAHSQQYTSESQGVFPFCPSMDWVRVRPAVYTCIESVIGGEMGINGNLMIGP
jgi:hypothetical protein